jgi:hypothetical protein
MKSTPGNIDSPQECQVIDEDKQEEEKGGFFSSMTGYLGKGTKTAMNDKQEKEIEGQPEPMITKANTRHQKEEVAR